MCRCLAFPFDNFFPLKNLWRFTICRFIFLIILLSPFLPLAAAAASQASLEAERARLTEIIEKNEEDYEKLCKEIESSKRAIEHIKKQQSAYLAKNQEEIDRLEGSDARIDALIAHEQSIIDNPDTPSHTRAFAETRIEQLNGRRTSSSIALRVYNT